MTATIDLIQDHRSIRRFTDQQIEPELLNQLMRAGQSAATSSFIQATTVIRVTETDVLTEFVELTGGQKYIATAAEFLVFCADLNRNNERATKPDFQPDYGWTEQFLAATVDVALFAQNVVIAAESAGLGICYIGGVRNDPEKVSALLELPDLVYPVFGLCIGYPDQHPGKKPRLPVQSVMHQERYNPISELAETVDQYDSHVREYYIERTRGKLDQTWSDQMASQAKSQSRPFMLNFLNKKGFLKK